MTSEQILKPEEYIARHKKAFRIAFDFLNAHFPPIVDDEYWNKTAADLVPARGKDPDWLVDELLCAVYAYLEKEYKLRRNQDAETGDRGDRERSQRDEDDDD